MWVRNSIFFLFSSSQLFTEPARELLDLVMDGPESDSVWVAYQIEPENDSMDEEEIEARLMEADI